MINNHDLSDILYCRFILHLLNDGKDDLTRYSLQLIELSCDNNSSLNMAHYLQDISQQ